MASFPNHAPGIFSVTAGNVARERALTNDLAGVQRVKTPGIVSLARNAAIQEVSAIRASPQH